MAKEVKFFSFSLYYKRYFVLNVKQNCFYIQNEEVAKKVSKVPFQELLYIDSVQHHREDAKNGVSCDWKYSFALQTKDRKFFLFARNEEEQFLWLTAFYRMARVQVVDMKYTPSSHIMQMYSHRSTGFHYRVRDPDTSSREQMELSSQRLRAKQAKGGAAIDSGGTAPNNRDSDASEKGPFDSKPSEEKET